MYLEQTPEIKIIKGANLRSLGRMVLGDLSARKFSRLVCCMLSVTEGRKESMAGG